MDPKLTDAKDIDSLRSLHAANVTIEYHALLPREPEFVVVIFNDAEPSGSALEFDHEARFVCGTTVSKRRVVMLLITDITNVFIRVCEESERMVFMKGVMYSSG